MLKISPIAQYLRANHVKAQYLETTRSWPNLDLVKRYSLRDTTKDIYSSCVGKMSTCINKYGHSSAYHRVYVSAGNMQEQREQFVTFAKILGKDGGRDKFVPEKMTKTLTYMDAQGNLTKTHSERVISSKLNLVGKDEREGFNIYETVEPIKYTEKIIP